MLDSAVYAVSAATANSNSELQKSKSSVVELVSTSTFRICNRFDKRNPQKIHQILSLQHDQNVLIDSYNCQVMYAIKSPK